jgi:hypothetical protein
MDGIFSNDFRLIRHAFYGESLTNIAASESTSHLHFSVLKTLWTEHVASLKNELVKLCRSCSCFMCRGSTNWRKPCMCSVYCYNMQRASTVQCTYRQLTHYCRLRPTNDRPVLSSERASLVDKIVTVKQQLTSDHEPQMCSTVSVGRNVTLTWQYIKDQ